MNNGQFFGSINEWFFKYKGLSYAEVGELDEILKKGVEQLSLKDKDTLLFRLIKNDILNRHFVPINNPIEEGIEDNKK